MLPLPLTNHNGPPTRRRNRTTASLARRSRFSVGAAIIALGAWLSSAAANAEVVSDWNLIAQQVIAATPGSAGNVDPTYMHVAIYDAVNAIDGRYPTFAVRPTSDPRGASKQAAAAAAAYRTLLNYFPTQSATLQAAYDASLAAVADGPAKAKGIAIGEEVAAAWTALRQGDGRQAPVPYVFQPAAPGVYQRTSPGTAPPVSPWLAVMRPFVLTSPAQFRAYGPPDVTSLRFAQDFELTKALGSATSTERSAEETETARFHTEAPVAFWNHNFRDLAAAKGLGTTDSARFFAALSVANSDAVIACWDSKYYYNFWRPITAITTTLDDGNAGTETDPSWLPLATTPGHPEYPAAHGCVAGATAEVLSRFFGTRKVDMTFTSAIAGTVPHFYRTTDDLVEEIKWARVFGGMHYLTSTEHGADLGRRVGRYVMREKFQPLHHR